MSLFDANWEIQTEKLLPPVVRSADFIVSNDDFKPGDPENQYIHYILISSPGHWKEFPPVGVGIFKYLQSTIPFAYIQRAIRTQLENDVFSKPLVDASKYPVIVVNSVVVRLEND
jgi:hypothetical protein